MGQAEEKGPRVVVIDSDGDIRDLLEAMLDVAEEFRLVKVFADAELGLEEVAARQPDAVVLDLDDPELDGMETIDRLREAAPAARIVVISNFPDPLTLLEALRHGADEYLDKARAWADVLPTIELLCSPT
jgi:DNA-binding NarL/FixJ family response regulator